MKNVAVLVSGGGTNLQAILDSEHRGENLNGRVTLVVASKPGVYALTRAENAGVKTAVVARKEYADSAAFDAALLAVLKENQIDVVVLAGFLSVLGPSAIADFRTLSQLKVGDISPAYQTQDMNGNQLSKIVKLVQIIPTHVASLNEDYLRLEQMALNRKQEKVFGEWLSKKIDGMYVYIDPEFRDGEFANKHWVK